MNKTMSVIGILIAGIALVTSGVGLLYPEIYRDNDFITAMWFGNDLVTFFMAVPLLLVSIYRSDKHQQVAGIGSLVWLGCLWYMIYNYIYYTYGAAYNPLFILYVLIICLSLVNLILLASHAIQHLSPETHQKLIGESFKATGVFMIIFACFIGGMWLAFIIIGLVQNELPMGIEQTGHPTAVVFATDLIFLVTPLISAGIFVIKKNPVAIILSFMIFIKCILYPVVLLIAGIVTYIRVGVFDPLTPVYLGLGVICVFQIRSLNMKIRGLWMVS